eukprot:826639_1
MSLCLILFIVITVGCFSQLTPCTGDGLYPCVSISRLKIDMDGNNLNGKWIPYSETECYYDEYIYQLADRSAAHLYLCHGSNAGWWTITDTICNQTDKHTKARCERNRHDISYCGMDDSWYVQTSEGNYDHGGSPPPVNIQTNLTASDCPVVS